MKIKQLLLLLSGVGLVLTACNDSNEVTENRGEKDPIVVNHNSADLGNRVAVYKKGNTLSTRSDGMVYDMPACPSVDEIEYDFIMDGTDGNGGAISYSDKNTDNKDMVYFLPEGEKYVTMIGSKNNTFYVAGHLVLKECWGTCKIVVLPTGTLTIKGLPGTGMDGPCAIRENLTLLNYGEIRLRTYASWDHSTNSGNNEGYYLEDPKLIVRNKATFMSAGSITCGEIEVENGGTVYVEEQLNLNVLDMKGKSKLVGGCRIEVKDTVMLSDNAELNITGYLNTPILTMDNNATINMASGTLLSATSLEMNSATSSINVIGNNYSILDAGNLVLNAWDKGMFTGWLDIHGTVENKSGLKLDWLSNIRENGDTYLAADNFCTPEFGMGTDGEEDEILIDHIAEVASPNSKLSATSIQTVGDKAYVSYHVKGDGYGAAIDAFDVNSLEILSSCTAEEMDFNHILVEPSKVIVAGGEKRGALAGIITLNSGRFEAADFVKQKLAGGSANCIANNGSNYVVSSNTGFQALDLELAPLAIDPIEARYAKHVSIQGDKMVTLSGVENAEVKIFNATDIAMENPLQQFTVGAINPIDGKNVCRLDGDRVYVCKSKNGFAVYENGAEIWSLDKVANGVDFDDNYIYLVGEGLRIIDKTTFEVLAKYTHSEASANYVAAMEDGYIYVAYGLKGSQLFRLVSSNETK